MEKETDASREEEKKEEKGEIQVTLTFPSNPFQVFLPKLRSQFSILKN